MCLYFLVILNTDCHGFSLAARPSCCYILFCAQMEQYKTYCKRNKFISELYEYARMSFPQAFAVSIFTKQLFMGRITYKC